MRFIIDIDQTVSTGFVGASLKESVEYYQQLGITVPTTIATYFSLFQLPEVMQIHEALPGAVSAVQQLSRLGTIQYFTVRKGDNGATSEHIQNITKQWLAEHGFPSPSNVVFCRSMMHKLIKMHEMSMEEPLIFIDDRWHKAIEALHQLEEQGEEALHIAAFVKKHVSIVAFGTQMVPEHEDIHLMALPTWECIADVMARLQAPRGG
jgi:hypothetical protein